MNNERTTKPIFAAAMIAISASFLLGGYEFIRTPTNTLFKMVYGKENLPLVLAATPFFVALVVYLYTYVLSKFGARKTLLYSTLFSAAFIGAGQVAFEAGMEPAIVVLYLFRSAYVVLLIEQYWSFINSTLSDPDAKKYNGPICGIASIGAVLADEFGAHMTGSMGTSNMLLLAAACTVPAAFFSDFAYKRCGEPKPKTEEKKESGHLALGLFKTHKILIIILVIILLTQVLSAVLGLTFQGILQDEIPDPDKQSAYSFAFYGWINKGSMILQLIVAPFLLSFIRIGYIHVIIPIIHIGACIVYLKSPELATIAAAYLIFKCLDYSVFRAAKEILYIPLPFAARYRSKEVIDVFGYRFSKGGVNMVISIFQKAGWVFSEATLVLTGAIAAGLWALAAIPIFKTSLTKEKRP